MSVKRYVLGDPQAPFAAVMKLLASYDALAADGRLRPDVELISIGDHFDYDLTAPDVSRAEGLAVLRWLAAHPPEQVRLIVGNHDAARVVELALVDDREFAEARTLAWSIEATKRADGRAAANARAAAEFAPRFPSISTYGLVARDYASFSVEQRSLVVELMLAGRFHLALTGRRSGRELLITHAAVTQREVDRLGVAAQPALLAAALERVLADAISARRADWQRGRITPLSLEPVSQPGSPGEEAGGLLAHRPANTDRPGGDPAWELDPVRPRRFHPRELPLGLTQVAGHTNHTMCARELVPWVTPLALATRHAGVRTLRAGEAIVYDLGVLPPADGVADLILIDGELRDPANRAELLALH
jgi:Calcineurin-like phosphoesterase